MGPSIEWMPPCQVMIKNKITSSPKELAEGLNDHYVEKLEKLTRELDKDDAKAMEILNDLVPPSAETFEFREFEESEVYEIIQQTKTKRTVGNDEISSDLIKQIPTAMTIMITHLYNKIISTGVFPSSLKIARITPILKQGNDPLKPES